MTKRKVSQKISGTAEKDLYKSYIIPIVAFGASLWKASKTDLRLIESMQKKAVRRITGRKQNYKEALLKLKLLQLSLYHELHVLLLRVDILNKKYTLNWTNVVNLVNATQATRSEKLIVFKNR